MVNYQAKDLTKNVQILLKKNSHQFMLSRILDKPEFLKFLSGETPIRVFTPDKNMFSALLRMNQGSPPTFYLEPRSNVPSELAPGLVLLLVFPSATSNFIAQCVITDATPLVINVKSLDPRVNERRKTLLPTTLVPVPYGAYRAIADEALVIRRAIDYKNASSRSETTACRDVFVEVRNTGEHLLDPVTFLDNQTPTVPAIMADISNGGCCLYLQKNAPLTLFEATLFTLIHFDLPTADGKRTARIFGLIRQLRKSKGVPVVHCMFLEPIPDGFLEF